jgi:hypothetical protein
MIPFLVIIAIVFALIFMSNNAKAKELEALKQEYDRALLSGDKKAALTAGRNYYSRLRNGKLTIYDEQAITNDLTAMN